MMLPLTLEAEAPATALVLTWALETDVGQGSAVSIHDDGERTLFLTADHNLPGASIILSQGSREVEAEVVAQHPTEDVALLSAPITGQALPAWMTTDIPLPGAVVHAAGNHVGYELLVTSGYAGRPGICSTPVVGGCSGGAVVDSRGRLIGIIEAVTWFGDDDTGERWVVFHICHYTPLARIQKWLATHGIPL